MNLFNSLKSKSVYLFRYLKILSMTTQINLKFQSSFFNLVKEYAELKGYMNVQELIREALRDKLFDNNDLRPERKTVLKSKDANSFSSKRD